MLPDSLLNNKDWLNSMKKGKRYCMRTSTKLDNCYTDFFQYTLRIWESVKAETDWYTIWYEVVRLLSLSCATATLSWASFPFFSPVHQKPYSCREQAKCPELYCVYSWYVPERNIIKTLMISVRQSCLKWPGCLFSFCVGVGKMWSGHVNYHQNKNTIVKTFSSKTTYIQFCKVTKISSLWWKSSYSICCHSMW